MDKIITELEAAATAAEQSQTDPHRTVATLVAAVRKAVEDAKAAKPAPEPEPVHTKKRRGDD